MSLHKKSNFLYCNKDWLRSLCDYISATHINEQNTEIIQELNLSNVNISIGSDESESLEYITSILQLCQQHNIMKTLHISIRYIGYCILHYTVFCCLQFVENMFILYYYLYLIPFSCPYLQCQCAIHLVSACTARLLQCTACLCMWYHCCRPVHPHYFISQPHYITTTSITISNIYRSTCSSSRLLPAYSGSLPQPPAELLRPPLRAPTAVLPNSSATRIFSTGYFRIPTHGSRYNRS